MPEAKPKMRPEDVPAALVDEFERRLERAIGGRVPNEPTREDIAIALAAVLPTARRMWFAGLFGTPEEIAAREAEAANARPDDPVELCEVILPGEHERRVRAKVAEELREDAAAHRRLVARKPSEHDDARLARAKTLDDAAARITRGERP